MRIFLSVDIPGEGGESGSGDAQGGDATRKRALDYQTAGGSAHTGDSSSTSAGSVFNVGEDDGEITNTASSESHFFEQKPVLSATF